MDRYAKWAGAAMNSMRVWCRFKALGYPSGNCLRDQRAWVKALQKQLEAAVTSELVWKRQDARRCESGAPVEFVEGP
jgi:hypothetical protein